MTARACRALAAGLWAIGCATAAGCASNPTRPAAAAPAFASYAKPVIPATLTLSPDVRTEHERAWQLLQSGDVRGATRAFTAILARAPESYPSEAGLAWALLASRDPAASATRFRAALARDARYVPAWEGLVEAELARDDLAAAIDALEQVVALDPQRDDARTRLVVLRLTEAQSFIDGARRAREAGRPDEARTLLDRALGRAPSSASILAEIASLEVSRGRLDEAELYARRALQLEAGNARAQTALAEVAEARDRAAYAHLPAAFRQIGSAASVTRGEAAAFIGIRLDRLVASAPSTVTLVITDTRQHWAEPWILAVTARGIMDVQPNHTFQPARPVRRDELAATLAVLVELAAASRPADLERWKSSRPPFADVPAGHLFYEPAALAVACGALAADDGQFQPARAATGAEFVRAIARIQSIAGR
jgi:tetratricopeptide (TPR) repeat protein